MKARVIVTDERTQNLPTFKDVQVGEMFTEPENNYIYIKMRPCKCDEISTEFNAICLDGDTSWFDDDEEIQKINEIAITIN